jgi:hypothetical protein
VLAFIFLNRVNISTVLPQRAIAVVIDNSASMTIKDDGQNARLTASEGVQTTNFLSG